MGLSLEEVSRNDDEVGHAQPSNGHAEENKMEMKSMQKFYRVCGEGHRRQEQWETGGL